MGANQEYNQSTGYYKLAKKMPISPEARHEGGEMFYIFDWEFFGLGQKTV